MACAPAVIVGEVWETVFNVCVFTAGLPVVKSPHQHWPALLQLT